MDIIKAVAGHTGTKENDWDFIDGPDSGAGVDYWLRHVDGRKFTSISIKII